MLVRNPNLYYGSGRRTRRRGRGFLSNVWNGLKSAHNFIKSNKIISTAGNALSSVHPLFGTVGKMAATAGYGRRRRTRRRRVTYRRPMVRRVRRVRRLRPLGMGRRRRVGRPRRVRRRRYVRRSTRRVGRPRRAGRPRGRGKMTTMRRRRMRRRGGSWLDTAKRAAVGIHKFVKDRRLVSHGLRTFLPNSNLHKIAHIAGYGRARRCGGANFFSTYQLAAPKFY